LVPAVLFMVLVAISSKYTLDEEGKWWYFVSAIFGGLTTIAVVVLV